MKRILLLYFLLFSITSFSQFSILAVWNGGGDGLSWDDPNNWEDQYIPQDGDDIIIDGSPVSYSNSYYVYGSLSLTGGTNLFISSDINLSGDFYVDESSTLTVAMQNLYNYAKIVTIGDCYMDGNIDLSFSTYVPQSGNAYYIVEASSVYCGETAPTVDFSPDTLNSGFTVISDVQCNTSDILFYVNTVNYTTAKYWDGEASDNNWNTASNWSPNGVPTSTDDIIINQTSGATVNTSTTGTTFAGVLMIGDNNTLNINSNFAMWSVIQNNDSGTINWNAGILSRTDINVQSFMFNYGDYNLNGAGSKDINNGFQIFNYGNMNLNQGNLNINTGRVYNFDDSHFNINGDNITVSYNSGTLHELLNFSSTISKTAGNGPSFIDLPVFTNYGTVESNQGILSIPSNYNSANFGTLSGIGSIELPLNHTEGGQISPGNLAGVLTFIKDLKTNTNATFNIQITGPMPGTEYDQIIVAENATLEGSINVILSYLPPNNASFAILTAADLISCNFPAQVTAYYNGMPFTFDIICHNNTLYLNGPGATLSVPSIEVNELEIYPNPVNDLLTIKLSKYTEGNWIVYNQIGQQVLIGNLNGMETKISTNSLASGIYIMQIKDQNNNTLKISKIIKD